MQYSVITASEGCCIERINVLMYGMGGSFWRFYAAFYSSEGVLIVGNSKLFMVHLMGVLLDITEVSLIFCFFESCF